MAHLKRRLWLGVALVALVLLGVGGWIYYTVYMTSDFALRHAEAFLFRHYGAPPSGDSASTSGLSSAKA